MRCVRLLCFLLLLLSNAICQGQYQYDLGVTSGPGFLYRHTNKIGHLIDHHPVSAELFVNKLTNGKKAWQVKNGFPETGYSIGYYNYGNESLGATISTLMHIQYHLLPSRSPHSLKWHMGTGLGFNTNPYRQETNNKNNILGSTVTFSLQARLIYTYQVNDWRFSFAPNLTHFSNGSIRQPNKGVNIITANFGISHLIGDQIPFDRDYPEETDRKTRFNAVLYSGMKSNVEGGDAFPFVTIHSGVSRQLTPMSGFATGIDLFYSIAMKKQIEDDAQIQDADFKRLGWVVGYEFYISRVSLVGQFGVYIYRPYKEVPPVYQRIGIKVDVLPWMYAAANLKTHAATAEMAEFGVGVRL